MDEETEDIFTMRSTKKINIHLILWWQNGTLTDADHKLPFQG